MGNAGNGLAGVQLHALKPVVTQERTTLAASSGVWGGGGQPGKGLALTLSTSF